MAPPGRVLQQRSKCNCEYVLRGSAAQRLDGASVDVFPGMSGTICGTMGTPIIPSRICGLLALGSRIRGRYRGVFADLLGSLMPQAATWPAHQLVRLLPDQRAGVRSLRDELILAIGKASVGFRSEWRSRHFRPPLT
jgi:hypothetical protein